jgi:hypothetical protein
MALARVAVVARMLGCREVHAELFISQGLYN